MFTLQKHLNSVLVHVIKHLRHFQYYRKFSRRLFCILGSLLLLKFSFRLQDAVIRLDR